MTRKIGIIGIGPRGGFALESLIVELANQDSLSNIHLLLFEATSKFGNGQVYDLQQASTNWLNINERILELEKRDTIKTNTFEILSFPSYHEWIGKDFQTLPESLEDTYPPRAQLGKYLSQRFQTLIEPLIKSKIASLYEEKVTEVEFLSDDKIQIKTKGNIYKDFDEVLLTIGHQPTELAQQILDWDKFTSNKHHLSLFKSPYPVANFLKCNNFNFKSTIGIRGFGLAMIDVVRGIAEKCGSFITTNEKNKSCYYQADQESRDMFVPFSLTGLPPVPKPLNAEIDKWFEPSKKQISGFEEKIENESIQKNAKSPRFVIAAFAPIAANIFTALPNSVNPSNLSKKEIEQLIVQWLEDNNIEHPIVTSVKQPTRKSMYDFVAMATGEKAISLDFCIGQVWRHCQPSIYEKLSFNKCSDSVIAEIIALDESTKRYSYGPPVESIQQMLALVEAGLLNLDMINDPDIELTNEGWRFHRLDKSITANMMIDSVLDSPKIKSVNSPIIKNMLSDNLIAVVHDGLGVTTDENGYLIPKNKEKKIPIALLGRLAKGTIIGVDAILECFGTRPQNWAEQAASNHINWLKNTLN